MGVAQLFIATSNAGKLREMRPLAKEFLSSHATLGDFSMEGMSPPLEEETGETYLANAQLKAHSLLKDLKNKGFTNFAILADDSGLSVDALGGKPGVRSARYAGDHVPPQIHMQKLLAELNDITIDPEKRTARYHCALSLLIQTDRLQEFWGEGTCEGYIGFEPEGISGFGYDPIFLVPGYGKTFGELPDELKQRLSHRRHAFEDLIKKWHP